MIGFTLSKFNESKPLLPPNEREIPGSLEGQREAYLTLFGLVVICRCVVLYVYAIEASRNYFIGTPPLSLYSIHVEHRERPRLHLEPTIEGCPHEGTIEGCISKT